MLQGNLQDLEEAELLQIKQNCIRSVEDMEDFLIDLEQGRQELRAQKKMYEATIKNIYQTSPNLFNCGVQQQVEEQIKPAPKSKIVKGKQTAVKAFDWFLRKTGIKKKTLLVPESIAKVLKSVKPGQLSSLKEPWFHKACKEMFQNFFVLEYPPTFNEAIPVPKDFNMIQQQNSNLSLEQQNKGELIRKGTDPLDEEDWNDIHREVLNDLNDQKNRSNSMKLSEEKKQSEVKKISMNNQLKKKSSTSSSASSGSKISSQSVRFNASGKVGGKQVKKSKIQLSKYTQLQKKNSGKGQRTIMLSQNNPDI